MSYTVKQLAKLASVTPKTLRFYDAIGLLKPAFYGDNGYRYYEKEQLLMLQQILFFRELNCPLSEIRRIILSDDFDKIESLITHQSMLQSTLEQTQTLLKTIDKTIAHLRGKLIMTDVEMYDGFDPVKQQEHEQYLLDTGILTQQAINDSWKKIRHWKKSNWEAFQQEGEALNLELAQAIKDNLKPEDEKVQNLVQRHHTWIKHFWTPTKESYTGLAQMYLEHPDYRAFYHRYHPDLVDYLVEAMRIFANRELS